MNSAANFEVVQMHFYNGIHVGWSVATNWTAVWMGLWGAVHILYMENGLLMEDTGFS